MKYFIRVIDDSGNHLELVDGNIVKNEKIKVFIHRALLDNKLWCLSEFSTGTLIGFGRTKKDAINDFETHIKCVGYKKFHDRVKELIKKHGHANVEEKPKGAAR